MGVGRWDVTWAEFMDLDPAERLWFYLMLALHYKSFASQFRPLLSGSPSRMRGDPRVEGKRGLYEC